MTRRDLSAEWAAIRRELQTLALPDSRFDVDLDQFIPGFAGIDAATERVLASPEFGRAKVLFVTPDNSMQILRWRAIEAGKTLVIPSYGLRRGFLRIAPGAVPGCDALYASWGDGIQHFGEAVAVADLASIGHFDAIAAGAAAVSRDGLRFGMGHRYLDLEWNMFLKAGCLALDTPVWTIVHDVQVLDSNESGDSDNVYADRIFTPSRTIETRGHPQPSKVRRAVFAELFPMGSISQALEASVRLS